MIFSANDKIVLLISPLPPPAGGIASWTQTVCGRGLPGGYLVHLIDNRLTGRSVFEKTTLSGRNVLRTLRVLRDLILAIVRFRPVVVHMNCSLSPVGVFGLLPCVLIVKICGVPLVCHFRGNIADFNGRSNFGFSGKAISLIAQSANINIAVNYASSRYLTDDMRISPGKTVVIPNFFNESQFGMHRISKMPSPRTRAIFVGGITRAKGCAEIVEIARRIPEIQVALLGKRYADMDACLTAASGNVEVLPPCSLNEVFEKLAYADIFIFPSHTEGFPNAVLEAMVAGLPVVATRVGAIPDMLGEDGGLLVTPGDIDGLELAVRALIADPMLRVRMGDVNRESARRYSYAEVAVQLTGVYDRIISEEGARACAVSRG